MKRLTLNTAVVLALALTFSACGGTTNPIGPDPNPGPGPGPNPGPGIPELRIATQSLPDGRRREEYSALVEAAGGTEPHTFGATGLPTGLDIHSTNGEISGKPIMGHGSFSVTVTVNDAADKSVSTTLSLNVAAAGEDFKNPATGRPVGVTIEVLRLSPPEGSTITASMDDRGNILSGVDWSNPCKENRCFEFGARVCNETQQTWSVDFVWGSNDREPVPRINGVGGYKVSPGCMLIREPPGKQFILFQGNSHRYLIGALTERPTPGWNSSWPRWAKETRYTTIVPPPR